MHAGWPDLITRPGTGSQQEEEDNGNHGEENYSSRQSADVDCHTFSSCWTFPGGVFAIRGSM
jgi:hypothetical protein